MLSIMIFAFSDKNLTHNREKDIVEITEFYPVTVRGYFTIAGKGGFRPHV